MIAEKIQAEAEQQRLAEEKRQTEIAALSPEDLMIAEVNDPSVIENRIVEIFNSLGEFAGDKKSELAEAIKNYWQIKNKWKKKKCAPKQWKQVVEIKKILGE